MNRRYHIYPSIMDGYSYYQTIEDEDARAAKKRELIDNINRVPHEPIEAASRGTALNEIVDSIIERRNACRMNVETIDDVAYRAIIDGFTFDFDKNMVHQLSEELAGCLCQQRVEAEIEVPQGVVTLYGYADYIATDTVIDLKTTETYTPGKYRDHWQHRVYPYCLVRSGMMDAIDSFHYLVAELQRDRKSGVYTARFFDEEYTIGIQSCEDEIRRFLTYELLPFLDDNRNLITDKKIFGL